MCCVTCVMFYDIWYKILDCIFVVHIIKQINK